MPAINAIVVRYAHFIEQWQLCSPIEALVLQAVASGKAQLHSAPTRQKWASQLAMDDLPVTTVQSAVRALLRKQLLGKSARQGHYFVEDAAFADWTAEAVQ